jgi:hypothetical protein
MLNSSESFHTSAMDVSSSFQQDQEFYDSLIQRLPVPVTTVSMLTGSNEPSTPMPSVIPFNSRELFVASASRSRSHAAQVQGAAMKAWDLPETLESGGLDSRTHPIVDSVLKPAMTASTKIQPWEWSLVLMK